MAYIGKSPSSGIRNRFIYTATAGQTTFSGGDDHSRTLSYTDAEFTDVFLNGVKLDKSDYTATSGTSIVLDEGAAVDDILEVLAFDTFSVFSGEFSQDVTVGGTLDVQGGEVILDADGDTSITANTDDQIDFKTGGTDRMVIDASGDVFIDGGGDFVVGASTSQYQVANRAVIEANGASTSIIALGIADNQGGYIFHNGTDMDVANYKNGDLNFITNNTTRATIDSSGRLLVNTTSNLNSGSRLEVHTNGTSYSTFRNTDTGTAQQLTLVFTRNATTVGSVNTTNTSTIYSTSSDYRLKENAVDISDGITRVKQLQPKRFNFIADDSTTVDGFLAHQAQAVVPEAVTGTHNEVETWTQDEIDAGDAPANTSAGDNKLDGDGNTIPIYQGIDQAKLVPLLTAALQEAITKIEALETKVAALEAGD